MLVAPLPPEQARRTELVKGPNIARLPDFDPLPDRLELPVALKVGDDVSTDEILPAGAKVLPFRSNIPAISDFAFAQIDTSYPRRVRACDGPHCVVGGANYGQGSSREHAAIAPRYLRLRVVVATSFARIHWQNLANFGIVALEFADASSYDGIEQGDVLVFDQLPDALRAGGEVDVANTTKGTRIGLRHRLSDRQVAMVIAGGQIPRLRAASGR
jgi:aconitate hydratase